MTSGEFGRFFLVSKGELADDARQEMAQADPDEMDDLSGGGALFEEVFFFSITLGLRVY